MEIKGKVHCFFEQSGTFKNEFIKLGIPAEDYDIQNNFGETNHTDDLFAAIETAYEGGVSLFDDINSNDLIIAFFPCIYFCDNSEILLSWGAHTKAPTKVATDRILARSTNRHLFYTRVIKMLTIAKIRGLRLIMENPWGAHSFLQRGFIMPPTFIDKDRTLRGDYFAKPTAYWFINCEPTFGNTIEKLHQAKRVKKDVKGSPQAGICNEERSMISPDYARNFICDFILGKPQTHSQLNLFD